MRTKNKKVSRTERGWAGHFICAHKCRFRRNTLIECGNKRVIVSTVGLMEQTVVPGIKPTKNGFDEIGYQRYYETMAFKAQWDGHYWDADTSKEISFQSPWAIDHITDDSDQEANDMHQTVCNEIAKSMEVA